jgi:hypothetical protein
MACRDSLVSVSELPILAQRLASLQYALRQHVAGGVMELLQCLLRNL